MNIEEYKQKLKIEQEKYEEIKALDFPRPIFHCGLFKWSYTCPVCNKNIKQIKLNGHDVAICDCGYGHAWKNGE